ncbi:hypothetical protein LWI29_012064 [Acer saccharum]|uniref:MI domain-containing protein n=1 Tax=Acer saccharum TaxID=4024 RepID=A0AA39RX06_ACESA|nr:hypothetical protein LWI29_012064 [Acer saccharum]
MKLVKANEERDRMLLQIEKEWLDVQEEGGAGCEVNGTTSSGLVGFQSLTFKSFHQPLERKALLELCGSGEGVRVAAGAKSGSCRRSKERSGSGSGSYSNGERSKSRSCNCYFGRYAGDRLLRCWGGRKGLDKEEYESGGVVGEACQCISDLGMHKVVKKSLVMAMEMKNDRMLDLLQECASSKV